MLHTFFARFLVGGAVPLRRNLRHGHFSLPSHLGGRDLSFTFEIAPGEGEWQQGAINGARCAARTNLLRPRPVPKHARGME